MQKKYLLLCLISSAHAHDGYKSNYTVLEHGKQYMLTSDIRSLSSIQQDEVYKKFCDNIHNVSRVKKLIKVHALDLIRYKELRHAVAYLVKNEYEKLIREKNNFLHNREDTLLPDFLQNASLCKMAQGALLTVGGVTSTYFSYTFLSDIARRASNDPVKIVSGPAYGICLLVSATLLSQGVIQIYRAYNHSNYLDTKITALKLILDQLGELSAAQRL